MSKFGKILFVGMVILMLAVSPVFSQGFDISKMVGAIEGLSDTMASALPFYSTIGLNWSDAYIGQLLAFPPHFGFGATIGITTMGKNLSAFDGILGLFGDGFSLDDSLSGVLPFTMGAPLPAVLMEARVGGIIANFDVGVKYMGLSAFGLDGMVESVLPGVTFEYEMIGADIRFPLLPPIFPIKVSVGGGVNYLRGGFGYTMSETITINFDESDYIDDVSFDSGITAGIMWETLVIEAKAQVSIPLFIITPYAGFGVSYGWSKAGFDLRGEITTPGIDDDDLRQALSEAGLAPDLTSGIKAYQEFSGVNFRIYGGLSLNLFVIRLDFTGMYNLLDGSIGGSLGIRFQL